MGVALRRGRALFDGGMAGFVRKGRKIKKDAPKIGAGMDVHDFWRERIG